MIRPAAWRPISSPLWLGAADRGRPLQGADVVDLRERLAGRDLSPRDRPASRGCRGPRRSRTRRRRGCASTGRRGGRACSSSMPEMNLYVADPALGDRTVAAVAVPPPPSSVNRKGLPSSSTAVSSMPTTSSSRMIRLSGAPKASSARAGRRHLRGVGQLVHAAERHEIERLAAGVQVEHGIRQRQQAAAHVVRDHQGRRAARIARERAVQVDLVDRRDPRAGEHGRQVHRRQQDHAGPAAPRAAGCARLEQCDRALVLVAAGRRR